MLILWNAICDFYWSNYEKLSNLAPLKSISWWLTLLEAINMSIKDANSSPRSMNFLLLLTTNNTLTNLFCLPIHFNSLKFHV